MTETPTQPVIDQKTGEIGLPFDDKPDFGNSPTPSVQAKSEPPATKVATTPTKIVSDPIANLLLARKTALANFLGNESNAMRFMSSVMHAITKAPKLRECTQSSLLGAFMECAALGLYPGSNSGDCYVLPYKTQGKMQAQYKTQGEMQAQFQMGYRGFKTLAYRAGINACGTDIVYERDEFREERGTTQNLVHRPAHGDRGKPIGAYAWAKIGQENIFRYMTKDEIMKIKAMSKSKDSSYSPWSGTNDPLLWMWQKTVFKQLAKLLPTSERLERAIYVDNVNERGGHIDGDDRMVVEVPFEETDEEKIDNTKAKKESLRKKNTQ